MDVVIAWPDGRRSDPIPVVVESTPSIYWDEGHAAYGFGVKAEENPYDPLGRRAREWSAGWAQAMADDEARNDVWHEMGEPVG